MKTNRMANHRMAAAVLQTAFWFILLVVDLTTKQAAVSALKGKDPVELIPGVLELRYIQNTGAAFSLLENAQWLFILIALAAIAVIGWFLSKLPDERRYLPLHVLPLLISAGAAGNLTDRLLLHYVRDFIYISLIDFPIFNVADMYVTISTVLLLLYMLLYYRDEDFLFLRRDSGRTSQP